MDELMPRFKMSSASFLINESNALMSSWFSLLDWHVVLCIVGVVLYRSTDIHVALLVLACLWAVKSMAFETLLEFIVTTLHVTTTLQFDWKAGSSKFWPRIACCDIQEIMSPSNILCYFFVILPEYTDVNEWLFCNFRAQISRGRKVNYIKLSKY
ncbi:hypothetical protein HELRODRAFT_171147 [Helobdella robusta]|uniref:Uncharacterized protein n=1 Tax=Helobdella robusta TaxID=6412 RepID=T1F3V1_HELRO|nr:hypothetical protein HELRODRAFT_171147 [Helobdella robusta]ESO05509.1 hypothetical protein HELRODRAFT_171147 [Helobdella robusta]